MLCNTAHLLITFVINSKAKYVYVKDMIANYYMYMEENIGNRIKNEYELFIIDRMPIL